MALAGNGWRKQERYARLGQLGGYQHKGAGPLPPYKPGMPKLTQQQQMELCADYMAHMKVAVIAAKYGVSPSYVSILARRRGLPMRESEVQRSTRSINKLKRHAERKSVPETNAQRLARLRQQLEK